MASVTFPPRRAFCPRQRTDRPCSRQFCVLTHGKSWTSRLIRLGQKLRYWGADRIYTRWNHAAIFVSDNGDIVEALGGGVQRRNIVVYKNTEYHVVRLEGVPDVDRKHEIDFAMACLNDEYGYTTILNIALSLLFASVRLGHRWTGDLLRGAWSALARFSPGIRGM